MNTTTNPNPPGMDAFLHGSTRGYMEIVNRNAGHPCYCSSIWSGYCDFCSGLAAPDSQRAKDQREAQRPTHPAVAVRAIVKAACKTLSVRRGSGTAYCWTEIRGSGLEGFTETEAAALKALGLNPGGNFCCLDSKDAKAFIATTAAERRIGARFLVNGVHVPISGKLIG